MIHRSELLQVNLFQKLATSAEHVVYQNCSECQNKTKTTICVHNMFCRYSELTIFMNNEQSVVILWVSWCKNKSFWHRFTCKWVFFNFSSCQKLGCVLLHQFSAFHYVNMTRFLFLCNCFQCAISKAKYVHVIFFPSYYPTTAQY
jgi:hypothetical protein